MSEQKTSDEQKPDEPAVVVPEASIEGDKLNEAEKLRGEVLDLREKFLALRENDLFPLRVKLQSVQTQLIIAALVGALVASIAGTVGVRQYSDFRKLLEDTMNKRIDDSVRYYDQLNQALMLSNNGGCSAAIPIFKNLSEQRPDDEVVFANAANCFISVEDYDHGYEFIKNLEDKGIFPNRFNFLLSYNNAGVILMNVSSANPSLEGEALTMLQKAEQIGQLNRDSKIMYPLYNLVIFYVARNDMARATVYADRLKSQTTKGPEWRDDQSSLWFKRLEAKQPQAKAMLEQLLPKKTEGSESLTPRK